MKQKIIRVRENEPIPHLDEHTETWKVVRVIDREVDPSGWPTWLHVLVELDEEDSARKLERHQEYLRIVDRIRT